MSQRPPAPPAIEPDTKDWTWVLERPCVACDFDPAAHRPDAYAHTIRAEVAFWSTALADPRATARPSPTVWSATEYACHVRDVHRLFAERVGLMLAQDDPTFAAWDQDETAIADRYDLADPAVVAAELAVAAEAAATAYGAVEVAAWARTGRRGDGSRFTVESLGRYHLHDVLHHRWDVATALGA